MCRPRDIHNCDQHMYVHHYNLQEGSKKKSTDGGPPKPLPYAAHKFKNIIRPRTADKHSPNRPVATEHPLLDLVSSWDSSANTQAGISNFKKDTSQILKPIKPEEETGSVEVEEPHPLTTTSSIAAAGKPDSNQQVKHVVVTPREDGSVDITRLDQFESEQIISAESAIYAVPSSIRAPSPSPEAVSPSTDTQTTAHDEASRSQAAPDETTPTTYQYRALFDYEATHPSELTIREGDIVTFVPTTESSPGWTMVCLSSGEQGWAPESYLQLLEQGQPQEVGDDIQATADQGMRLLAVKL